MAKHLTEEKAAEDRRNTVIREITSMVERVDAKSHSPEEVYYHDPPRSVLR